MLWEATKLSPKVAVPFCISTKNEWTFLLASLPAFGGVCVLDFGHSDVGRCSDILFKFSFPSRHDRPASTSSVSVFIFVLTPWRFGGLPCFLFCFCFFFSLNFHQQRKLVEPLWSGNQKYLIFKFLRTSFLWRWWLGTTSWFSTRRWGVQSTGTKGIHPLSCLGLVLIL